MIDGVEIQNDPQKSEDRPKEEIGEALFGVNLKLLFRKEEHEKNDPSRKQVAEEDLLHEREISREVDKQIHPGKAERRAQDE